MSHPDEDRLVVCPVCEGTPGDHGAHDWRFDKWSEDGPVVWRCIDCGSVATMCSREAFRRGVDHHHANVIWSTQVKRLQAGEPDVGPCDVCGGTGRIPDPSLAASEPGGRTVCPRCGLGDRVVEIVRCIGGEPHAARSRYGEIRLEPCVTHEDSPAHYCGRCDFEFGCCDWLGM